MRLLSNGFSRGSMSKPRGSDEKRRSGLSRRGSAWRLRSRFSLVLVLLALACCPQLSSQTQPAVAFAGAQTTLPFGQIDSLGVTVDRAGNVFVTTGDGTPGNAVLELPAAGGAPISIGGGFDFPQGVAVDAAGDVFVANGDTPVSIVEVPAGGGTQIVVATDVSNPAQLAIDAAGDLLVADDGNGRILKIPVGCTAANCQSTVGVGFSQPMGVAVDSAGDVFVADAFLNEVIDVPFGCANADCQVVVASGLNFPQGVAVDSSGNVFIAETGNDRLLEAPAGGGAPFAVGIGLGSPFQVAVDVSGNVFVATNGPVFELQLHSVNFGGINICPAAGAPAPCTETLTLNYNVTAGITLLDPVVTTGGAPNLDFTVAPNSTCTGTITGTTCVVNVIFTPSASGVREGAVTVTEEGECARFPCNLPHATTPVFGTGLAPEAGIFGILFAIQPATASTDITGVAVDGAGNYYYSDQGGNTVYEVTNGATTPVGFTGLNAPQQLAIDGSGAIYVQTGGSQIIERATNGVQTTLLSTIAAITPNLEAYLENIGAFALDPQGDIYVGGPAVGSAAGEVVKFDALGNLTVVGTGYGTIESMTVGPDGTVYIVSVNPLNGSTTVSTIGPGGQQGTLAIALPPISAIAVDAGGTVYLAEDSEAAPFTTTNLLVIDATGVETNYQLAGVDIPNQMAITPTGGFYIANEIGSQTGNPSGNIFFYSRDASGGFGFNDVPVGTTAPGFPVPVLNIGNEPLTIFGLTYAAQLNQTPLQGSPFTEAPVANSTPKECATTLAGGATCVVTNVFSPPAPGAYTGNFTLSDNSLNAAATNPATQTYDLFGTGIGPPISMTLTGPANPPVFGGFPGVYTVTETDVTGAPVQGDNDVVNFVVTGPEQFNFLSTTLTNGQGTLTLTLNEPGTYTMVATDATNGLTATDSNFTISSTGSPGLNYATIGLTLNPTTPYYFDNALLTVTVTGANVPPPTGTISYSVDNGATQTATLNSATGAGPTTATVQLGQLAIGAHSVSVTYSGGANFYLQSGPEVLDFNVADAPLSLVSSERLQAFANAGTPNGVAVDSSGDVFIADTAGAQVLEYTPAGVRSVVPLDLVTPNGLAVNSFGSLYVSDSSANQLYEYNAIIGQQTLSFQGLTPGTLNDPGKIAVGQNGSVYVADTGNNRVVFLNSDSFPNVVPAIGLNAPQGVAADAAGNIYIADTGNNRVVKIDTSGNQTTILSTPDPIAVTVDANGNVYVLDGDDSDTVTRIDTLGHQEQLNGVGFFNGFNLFPVDIAADTLGNLFVPGTQGLTNQNSADLLVISTNPGIKVQDVPVGGPSETGVANYLIPSAFGVAPAYAATDLAGDGEFAGNQLLNCTNGIAANGVCTFTISFNPILPGVRSGSFTLSNANGVALRTDAVYGNGLAPLAMPQNFDSQLLDFTGLVDPVAIAVDGGGNIYVADAETNQILEQTADGVFSTFFTAEEAIGSIAVDGLGNVYATYADDVFLVKINAQGQATNLLTNLTNPGAVAVDGAGNVYVADTGIVNGVGFGQIQKVDPTAAVPAATTIGQGVSGSTYTGLAVDGSGNIHAATSSGTIVEINSDGTPNPAGAVALNFTPGALAINAGGELLVVDTTDNTIDRVDAAGNQTNSSVTTAQITSLALDGSANVYYTTANAAAAFELDVIQIGPFLTAAVGSTSAPGTYRVSNVGNQPLDFSAITVPAPFAFTPADTPQGTTSCSLTAAVPAGTDCQVPVVFTPTTVGAANGTAVLTDNSLNNAASIQNFSVQGTGTGVTPVSLTLTGPATGVVGQSANYTVTELGAGGVAATGDSDVVSFVTLSGNSRTNQVPDIMLVNGVGTFTFPYLSLGETGIVATDITNPALTQTLPITVTPALATTTLALAVNPAAPTVADLVSVVVTLGGDQGQPAATGTITYTLDGVAGANPIQVGLPNSPGAFITAVPLGRLAAGPHSFVATYSGDGNYLGAGPATLPFSVAPLIVTTTTLAISAPGNTVGTVASGTAVTLTAAVTVNGDFVSPGLVIFCDATATHCDNSALLGTAQLTTAGTATLRFIPGIGVHSYNAIFAGTGSFATSASTAQPLTVTGVYPTTTTIQSSGNAGDYTLTATVAGAISKASGILPPLGTASFVDTTPATPVTVATAPFFGGVVTQTFAAEVPYPTGTNPQTAAVGDFNGDGIPDLVLANFSSSTVSVLLGNGGGTFQVQLTYATGGGPESVAVGDFNGDGVSDLVVANATDDTVGVLLGNGDGTFKQQVTYATGGSPTFVAVGDFNGDGVSDLVVANEGQGSGSTVSVLLGNGDGTFGNQVAYATGNEPNSAAVGDFNGDGILDLAVANIGSNTVSVLLGNGDGTFQAQVTYATGNQPFSVAAGDFTGSGVLALAVANNLDNTISVLLGNGDGTFSGQVAYGVGTNPRTVVVGDLNGDGIPDLATADSNSNTASVLLGKGDGTFNARTAYATGGAPFWLAIGDLNGDGVSDLAVADARDNTVSVLLNQLTSTSSATAIGVSIPGVGTQNVVASYPGNAPYAPSVSPSTPLMGSGIATTLTLTASPAGSSFFGQSVTLTATLTPFSAGDASTNGETIIFQHNFAQIGTGILQNGVATFTTTALPVGFDPIEAAYGGDTTFAATTSGTGGYLVNEPATTATTLAITAGGNAVATVASGTAVTLTATVTVNGDFVSPGLVTFCDATALRCENSALLGTAQLTTAGTAVLRFVPGIGAHSYKTVFTGTQRSATSTSGTQALTVTGTYPTQTTIAASGTAGDYTLEATVVGTGSATLSPGGNISFLDTSNGNASLGTAPLGASVPGLGFFNSSNPATGNSPVFSAVGDFNGDGIPDLAVANYDDATLNILLGNGDGTFTLKSTPATGTNPNSIGVGDFNGDGKTDLAVTDEGTSTVTILLGNGDGTFNPVAVSPATGGDPVSVAVGDFNGDGIPDLATANFEDDTVTVLLGNGDGTFTPAASPVTGANPYWIATADFNGDGIADLAVTNATDNTVSVLLGNGDGTFTAAASPGTGNNPYHVVVADFNGDGRPDLAVANRNDNTLSILTGNGDGTFATAATPTTGSSPASLAVGDFNADGKLDLAVGNSGDNTLTILLGNGDGTFTASAALPATGVFPYAVAVGDFNGDGLPDVAAANANGNSLTVLLTQLTQTTTATLADVAIPGTGTHNVDASYPGSANFGLSVSQTTPLAGTAASVASVSSNIAFGASIPYGPYTETATVAGAAGLPVPTGTLGYTIDGAPTVAIPGTLVNGSIAFQLPQLAVGNHTIGYAYSGDARYAGTPNNVVPASLYVAFTITRAALTVIPNSLTSVYGQPLPALTSTITGFVFNDTTASTVTGAPALTTTATTASAPGKYPITAAIGTLAATNYTFNFAPGTLTISQAAQTIAFTPISSQNYGAAAFGVTATATSGLPVTVSVQSGPATVANNQVTVNGVGTVVLAGSEAGNADYSAAPTATTSFAVVPAATSIALSVTSNLIRTPNTISLSATVSSAATGESGTVSFLDGATLLGTSPLSATDTAVLNGVALAVGSHNITASYAGATDFAVSTSTAANVVVEPLAVILNTISPTLAEAGSSDTTITANGADFSPSAVVNFNGTPLATTFVNATQLTAVIPAAQLATAATVNVTVTDTYSTSTSGAQTFTILPAIAVTFTGPPSSPPGEQPTLTFQLQQPYVTALNGTMTLTFTPDPGNPDDPQVQFATGGRTFNFTLPPNTTLTPLVLLQAGTISGTISVSLQLTASGINVTPPTLAPIAIVVPKVAPTVSAVTLSASGNTLTVVVTGYSSTREIQSATFAFTPAAGASLAEKSLTVPANTLFETWYTTADSAQFGSAFTYTQLFTLSGPATAVGGVGVTLTNTIGTSTEVSSQ
jgi:sugar lactone lactonase YvrE